jgi:hypothetical protein
VTKKVVVKVKVERVPEVVVVVTVSGPGPTTRAVSAWGYLVYFFRTLSKLSKLTPIVMPRHG